MNIKRKNKKNRGLSLIELVTAIAILAVLVAVLVPSLIRYTEQSRAGRDVSAMDEITNAFFVSMADTRVYDEVFEDSLVNNISCYIDSETESTHEALVVRTGHIAGVASQYTFSEGARKADETVYHVAGNMKGMTVTFEPKYTIGNETYYTIADGIINKYTSETKQLLSSNPYLCAKVQSIVGETVSINSQTYHNSEFTVFIRLGNVGGNGDEYTNKATVYGQYSGTNLSADDEDPELVKDRISEDNSTNTPSDGTQSSGGTGDLNGDGSFYEGDDINKLGEAYAIYSESTGTLTFVRSETEIVPDSVFEGIEVTEVYTGFETARYTIDWDTYESTTPWDHHWEDIRSVVVRDEIRPLSTSAWFYYFENCTSIDLTGLNTKNTTDMSWMFAGAWKVRTLNVSRMDTSKVFDMSGMFCGMCNLASIDLSKFDTSNVTHMNNMFYCCESLTTLNLSSFNTAKVQDTYWMFGDCGNLTTIYASSERWSMESATETNDMFNGTTSVIGGNGTMFDWYEIDGNYAQIDLGTTRPGYLTETYIKNQNPTLPGEAYAIFSEDDNSLTFIRATTPPVVGDTYNGKTIDGVYTGFETETYEFMQAPWYVDGVNNLIYKVSFDGDIRPLSTAYWFAGLQNCSYINVTKLDTSNTQNMSAMFCCAGNALSSDDSFVVVGLDTLDVSKVVNMSDMFRFCAERVGYVRLAGIESWSTQSATDMSYMFQNFAMRHSDSFALDLHNWKVSKVTTFAGMFESTARNSPSFYINIDGWNTKSATNMDNMFCSAGYSATSWEVAGLSGLEMSKVTSANGMLERAAYSANSISLDLRGWDVKNLIDGNSLFAYFGYNAKTMNLNVSNWNVPNLTSTQSMFYYCGKNASNASLHVDGWMAHNVKNTANMFYHAAPLKTIDMVDWDTYSITNCKYMFYQCPNLTTIYASEWWDMSNATTSTSMFYGCSKIVGQSGVTYNSSKTDKSMANYTTGYLTYKATLNPPEYVNLTIDNQCSDLVSVSAPANIVEGRSYIKLVPVESGKIVASCVVNGVQYSGANVKVEEGVVTMVITDVKLVSPTVFESAHNPYASNFSDYYIKHYAGATSITVTITYQTHNTTYDYARIYDGNGTSYGGKLGGTTKRTLTVTVPGNYVEIYFTSNASNNNYYGFYATLTPSYD